MSVPTSVLFVGGYSRSGSTLLARTLGQLPGAFFAGEIEFVWEKYFQENQPCSCGLPFRECDFWSSVVETAYGGFEQVDLEQIRHLKRSVERIRYIPQLASPWKTRTYQSDLSKYLEKLTRLYEAIREVSGSTILVDSSKVPRYAYTLANLPGIDLRVVHLVRDSRAVAYSWSRKKLNYEIGDEKFYMDRQGPFRSSVGWMRDHLLTEPLRLLTTSGYSVVRYEDFVREPGAILSALLNSLAIETSSLPLLYDGHSVELGVSHATEGNPMRFQRGVIELRPDTEWVDKMSHSRKSLVTSMTWPLLLRYGYSVRDSRGKLVRSGSV